MAIRISIDLEPDYCAFVEKFVSAGVFTSPDELIQRVLDAFALAMENHARETLFAKGLSDADDLGLEELADALEALGVNRSN